MARREQPRLPQACPHGALWTTTRSLRGVDRARKGGDIVEEMFRTRARWLWATSRPKRRRASFGSADRARARRRCRAGTAPAAAGGRRAPSGCARCYAQAARQLAAAQFSPTEAATVEGFRRLHDAMSLCCPSSRSSAASSPTRCSGTRRALADHGFAAIEVPTNSPDWAAACAPGGRIRPAPEVGAGTVLSVEDVDALAATGARLMVTPNTDVDRHSPGQGEGLARSHRRDDAQ